MRKVIFILVMTMMPFAANAEWVGGVGYYNISADDSSIDVSLGAIAASIGYSFETGDNFTIMPELRVGIGLGDDTISGVNIEIDSLLAVMVRGQYDFASGVYIYGGPGWVDLDLKASGGGSSASASESEVGFGVGFGVPFSDKVAGELSYETYDDADVIGVALKILFQ